MTKDESGGTGVVPPSVVHNEQFGNEKKGDTIDIEPVGNDREHQAAEEVFLAESKHTVAEFNKLLRKVDWILLPLMWWLYGIQLTDKIGLGIMNLFGLQQDTGMHGKQYSYLTVLFYTAYGGFEFPASYVMQRMNMGKTLATVMFLWGIVVLAQGFLKNWSQFAALRFVQGALECSISPGFNLVIARWYTSREHSSRSLVFQSGTYGLGIIVDLVFYGIARNANARPGGFAAWRGIEVFLGAQTILGSVIAWFLLGTPNEVRWLSHEEKVMANARIMTNHAGTDLTGKRWDWAQFYEVFRDPQFYFQFVNQFLSCVVNGAITTFATVIFKSFGFTVYETVLYDCPRNAVGVLWFAMVGYSSLKVRNVRMYWMIISNVITFAALLVIALLPATYHYRWAKMVMFWWTSIFVISIFSSSALISSNTAGRTKFSTMNALIFIAYCAGNITGSQVLKPKNAPHYIPGTTILAVFIGVDALVIFAWRFYLVWANKRKDREVAKMSISQEEAERRGQELGAQDVTDLRNPFFRYSM